MTTDDDIDDIAKRRGVSRGAVEAAREALERGGGTMAQLSHADFGGMAQWSQGGMSMVGDLFDSALKGRFDAVMADLLDLRGRAGPAGPAAPAAGQAPRAERGWWPDGLGSPSTSGSQNRMRYAYFPQARRLVIEEDGRRRVFDTGENRITGVSQQDSDTRTVAFSTASGRVRIEDLAEIAEDR